MANALGIQNATWLSKPLDFNLLRAALTFDLSSLRASSRGNHRPTNPDATHIKLALQKREFFPVFQPKVQIASGDVIGCEALARWISPDFGPVAPDAFIPTAESADYIKSLTMVMLEDSIVAAKTFVQKDPTFVLAVNLSARLLSDTSLPEEIDGLLRTHGFATSSLILEVTESVAMSDVSLAMDILLRLRIKGIGISMDDFGTGYSSLAVLSRMPFTEIKIDKSFVTNCLRDDDMWKIVRGATALGHEFKLKVVAEGVEDRPTWKALHSIGCDVGQGYHFSAALTAPEFTAWWHNWDGRPHDETTT
jgi:EAL domain-containing protein (putative c-di-GMP-specific phosphodiesterase class I)